LTPGTFARLDGVTAAVVGGAQGLLAECAGELGRAGADVVVLDVVPPAGTAGANFLECDVTDADRVSTCAREFRDVGALTLVSGVGLGSWEDSMSMPSAEWARVMSANLTGTMNCCAAFGSVMKDLGGGSIVTISSIFGVTGVDAAIYRADDSDSTGEFPAYAASKGGVIALTKALARYWASHGIRVNSISPGMFDNGHSGTLASPVVRERMEQGTPLGRIGVPSDLAGAVRFLTSDAASFITGVNLVVDGGWTI
jgi:NAD(P)-dependent dehydrogenase (short-subunit alcohol dehydrogenase family)